MNRTIIIIVGQVFNTLWGTLVSLLFATSDKLECKSSRRRGDEIDELRCFSKIGTLHKIIQYLQSNYLISFRTRSDKVCGGPGHSEHLPCCHIWDPRSCPQEKVASDPNFSRWQPPRPVSCPMCTC